MDGGIYAEIAAQDQNAARRREREAMSRVIDKLQKAANAEASRQEAIEALDLLDALWSIFLDDLAREENGLPDELRARLISIGLWIARSSMELRIAGGGDFEPLIEINTAIRDGLR
jgi:flagellar biosynthesis activator protein FlaF